MKHMAIVVIVLAILGAAAYLVAAPPRAALLLADEPTGRLEHQSRDAIMEVLRSLQREGLAIIIATHDLSLAQQTDRVIELKDGRIVQDEVTIQVGVPSARFACGPAATHPVQAQFSQQWGDSFFPCRSFLQDMSASVANCGTSAQRTDGGGAARSSLREVAEP